MARRLSDQSTDFAARGARSAARSRALREEAAIPPPPGPALPSVAPTLPSPDTETQLLRLAGGLPERAGPAAARPSVPPDWSADGFVGEIVAGFPYPRAGEDGQLGRSRESLRSTVLRVAPEQRRILHQIQQLERRRSGVGVELERIIDCAFVLVPADLDDIERFVDAAPRALLRHQPPAEIGTRLRASVHRQLDELRERFGADGRIPLRLTVVHRAALHHYCRGYLRRAGLEA